MAIKTIAENNYTHQEIFGQPDVWSEVFEHLKENYKSIDAFLDSILAIESLRIILTGAGSSAFIGESAAGTIQKQTKRVTQAIATTDLVTHAIDFAIENMPTLIVSFARSGNSPESIAALQQFDNICSNTYHLIITCNRDGDLAKFGTSSNERTYSIILPESTNDQSLAMTGSFTSMLLTSLIIFDREADIDSFGKEVKELCTLSNKLLEQAEELKRVAEQQFNRAIFLGSGPLLGIARECQLKLRELTDGQVICKHDSFLGFRHGPRVVANEQSLLIYLVSPIESVKKYENDLIESIAEDKRHIMSICVGCQDDIRSHESIFTLNHPLSAENRLLIISYTVSWQ